MQFAMSLIFISLSMFLSCTSMTSSSGGSDKAEQKGGAEENDASSSNLVDDATPAVPSDDINKTSDTVTAIGVSAQGKKSAAATEEALRVRSGGASALIPDFADNHRLISGKIGNSALAENAYIVAMNAEAEVFQADVAADGRFELALASDQLYTIALFQKDGVYVGSLDSLRPDGGATGYFYISAPEVILPPALLFAQAAEPEDASDDCAATIDLGDIENEDGGLISSSDIGDCLDSDGDGDPDSVDDDVDDDGIVNEDDADEDFRHHRTEHRRPHPARDLSDDASDDLETTDNIVQGLEDLLDAEIRHRSGRDAPHRFRIKFARDGVIRFHIARDVSADSVAASVTDSQDASVDVSVRVDGHTVSVIAASGSFSPGTYRVRISVGDKIVRNLRVLILSAEDRLKHKLKRKFRLKHHREARDGDILDDVRKRLDAMIVVHPQFGQRLGIEALRRMSEEKQCFVQYYHDIKDEDLPVNFITLKHGDTTYALSIDEPHNRKITFGLTADAMTKLSADLEAADGAIDLTLAIAGIAGKDGKEGTITVVAENHDRYGQRNKQRTNDLWLRRIAREAIVDAVEHHYLHGAADLTDGQIEDIIDAIEEQLEDKHDQADRDAIRKIVEGILANVADGRRGAGDDGATP